MIWRGLLILTLAACPRAGVAQEAPTPSDGPPRLAVLLVVDQLPASLLETYDSLFVGGFRRLLDGGVVFTQASHAYAQTHTAAGHTTLSTGTVPARHGIVANAWREKGDLDWDPVVGVGDPTVRLVSVPWAEGVSPANLRRDGLADWLGEAVPDARILSVAAKDRSAITLAARARTHVYWLNTYEARFVTSTYYRDRLPDWVRDFNEDRVPDFFADSVWISAVSPALAAASRADTTAYEGDRVHIAFPHRYLDEADPSQDGAFNLWVGTTPALDAATLAMAAHGVQALGLGADEVPDLLTVSLAQTDIVGHAYGPHSREQLDNLLRLDGELAGFFEVLDRAAGAEGWVVAVSSDHGAMPMPETLQEQGVASRRTNLAELQEMIVAARTIQAEASDEDDPAEVASRVAARLTDFDLIEQVFTGDQLLNAEPADSFAVLYARSYFPGRAVGYFGDADVLVRYPEWVLATTNPNGTDHRSGYWYDRHVPLVFMGPGIQPGRVDEPARAVDVAPTLYTLMGLDPPDDLDGKVLPVAGR